MRNVYILTPHDAAQEERERINNLNDEAASTGIMRTMTIDAVAIAVLATALIAVPVALVRLLALIGVILAIALFLWRDAPYLAILFTAPTFGREHSDLVLLDQEWRAVVASLGSHADALAVDKVRYQRVTYLALLPAEQARPLIHDQRMTLRTAR